MRWPILIPISSIVSFSLAFSIVWWSVQRRREREAYYRYELSRLMLEKYADGLERVFAWLREQDLADAQRRRDTIRVTAWVLVTGGLGALAGFRFRLNDDSLFGLIPFGIGVGLFVYLLLSRVRSAASTRT